VRLIRHLGFAVLAAMVLTAVAGAGTASATQFRSEAYPTTLNATQTTQHKLKVVSGTVQCTTANMTGTLSAASSSASLTPEMKSCTAFGLSGVPVVNSCKYLLSSTNEAEPFTGTMDITCSKEGDAIEVKALGGCVLRVPAQKGLAVSFANSEFLVRSRNRTITATINATGIKYTLTGPCPNGGSGSYENGTLTGASVIKGYDAPAEHAWGVYLAGSQVDAPPLFSTEGGSGVTTGPTSMSMSFGGTTPSCGEFEASASFPFAHDRVNLKVAKWNCYYGTAFSVNPNGCTLVLQATTSEKENAWGVMNIECPVGATIKFASFFGQCNVSIPAQTNRAKLTFNTVGAGKERKVVTGMGVIGIKYTATGVPSGCNGTLENGSLSASFNLNSGSQGFFVVY
jgi:hypothetical protein